MMDKTLPETAAENIRGPFVPKDDGWLAHAKGQLRTILEHMDVGVRISDRELVAKVKAAGEKFSGQSFHAQVRNLRKPDNGGFCIKTEMIEKVNYFTLLSRHGKVPKCDVCHFEEYCRYTTDTAVAHYEALVTGDLGVMRAFIRTFLKDRGMLSLIEPLDGFDFGTVADPPGVPLGPDGDVEDLLDEVLG